MSEPNITDCFSEFFDNTATLTPKEQLVIAAGLVELMRRSAKADTVLAMAQLLVSSADTPWSQIQFSITQTLLGQEAEKRVLAAGVNKVDVAPVLQKAFMYFLAALQPDEPISADVLLDLVSAVAAEHAAIPSKPVAKKAPDIFTDALVARVFSPATVTPALLEQLDADMVYFRGELPGAKLSPDTRGIMFDTKIGDAHVLLETGEYVRIKPGLISVAASRDPADLKSLPPGLLLQLTVASLNLFMVAAINKEQESALNNGLVGKLTGPQHKITVSTADLQPLEHVFGSARDCALTGVVGATGPIGASVRFPVPHTDMAVVIDARTDSSGPYSVSRLVRENETGTETVIMRHEKPRLFTTKGIYIFPTENDGLVSVSAIF
jgi:hypothetical protein